MMGVMDERALWCISTGGEPVNLLYEADVVSECAGL